jgi:hypothetical protein
MTQTPLLITAEAVEKTKRSYRKHPRQAGSNGLPKSNPVTERKFTELTLTVGFECIGHDARSALAKNVTSINKEDREEWVIWTQAARKVGGDNKERFYELPAGDIVFYSVVAQSLQGSSWQEVNSWEA